MILSNFKLIRTEAHGQSTAEIDVTSGSLWWKRTATRMIAKNYCGDWFFCDDGSYVPERKMLCLVRAWEFKNGKKI